MPNKATPRTTKPAKHRGGKPRGGAQGVTLPRMVGGLVRFVGIVLYLLWRGLCKITPPLPAWQRLVRSPRFIRIAAAAVLLVASALAVSAMKSSLSEESAWRLDPARLQFTDLSLDWISGDSAVVMSGKIDASLRDSLAGLAETSAFDTELCHEIARRLAANPWVHGVERVERRFPEGSTPSSIRAAITIRRPVIRVPMPDRICFVDREGVVLPWAPACRDRIPADPADQRLYRDLSDSIRLVSGVYRGIDPVPGTKWENEQINAAISMEQVLRGHGIDKVFPVREVNVRNMSQVKNWDNQVTYQILSGVMLFGGDARHPVIWGKPPVHASTMEVPIQEKIRRLTVAIKEDPSLERLVPPGTDGLSLNQAR